MDLKCPGSGESQGNRWQNLEHLSPEDEVKFVIKDREDYEWSVEAAKKHNLESRVRILFSPVWGALDPKDLAQWILQDKLNVRYQLQLHKFIWSPETKGV
jgi:7-carboxy-7-deazaguanine synthase